MKPGKRNAEVKVMLELAHRAEQGARQDLAATQSALDGRTAAKILTSEGNGRREVRRYYN